MSPALELVDVAGSETLLIVLPAGVALALVGILAYVVKKRDRQRERIARAHQPPPPGPRRDDDG